MSNRILKKFIGDNQVDGTKILLENAQFVRAKQADGVTIKDILKLNASDKIEFSERPEVGGSALQTAQDVQDAIDALNGTLAADIDAEEAARIAADAVLQTAIDGKVSKAGDTVTGNLTFDAGGGSTSNVGASSISINASGDSLSLGASNSYMTDAASNATDIYANKIEIYNGSGQPILPTTPSSLTVKKYVDDQDAAEALARSNADTTLQDNINAEAASRSAADATLTSDLATEVARATAAEVSIQSEVDQVESDLSDEVDRATAAEGVIASNLTSEISRATAEESSIRADFAAADALLIPLSQKGVASGIATLDSNGLIPVTQLPSYVDDVIEAADLAAIQALTGETGKIYVALDTNKTYRWSGSAYIYITSGAVDSVNGQTGVVSLDAADILMVDGVTTVEGKLNSLQAEVDALDAASSGDLSALEARVDTAEADIVALEAADVTLQSNIDAEASARTSADNALDARLDTIEAKAFHKKKVTLSATDITNGYIDLDFVATSNSVSGFVDRLAIHEGDDYTLSEVASKTRVTFINSLIAPGTEALVEGDSVFFTYQA